MDAPPQARVRLGTADDARGVAALRWQWRTEEEHEVGNPQPEFVDQFSTWFVERLRSHVPAVAEAGGSVVGFGFLALVERVPGVARWERRSGYLQSIYVKPAHRNMGIGRDLIAVLLDEARRRQLSYVAVHPTEGSFSLYRRAGFSETAAVLEVRLSDPRPPS